MSNAAGFKRPGVACQKCGAPFSLFLGVALYRSVEKLPDPFSAKCPECGHEATYPKSQIGILVVVAGQ